MTKNCVKVKIVFFFFFFFFFFFLFVCLFCFSNERHFEIFMFKLKQLLFAEEKYLNYIQKNACDNYIFRKQGQTSASSDQLSLYFVRVGPMLADVATENIVTLVFLSPFVTRLPKAVGTTPLVNLKLTRPKYIVVWYQIV